MGQPGTISSLAVVHPSATVGEGTQVHPHAVVERGVRVGRNSVLYPGVFIGPDAVVGDECLLYPNVVVYDRCVLGNRVSLHANTVIGQDGFGFATHKGAHHKIPQTGIVVLEDDVEMGASCAIERAAVGETRIGKGTKFADLISIGHGTTIGEHCLFVSLVGVSGSVEIGNYVALGGQVGVVGHLRVGNFVQAAGRTVIVQDVPDGMKVGGTPAIPLDKAKRNALAFTELYETTRRLRRLEKELEELKVETRRV
jgi:UDP-3-O-[3-hydroxymyristoyl] glucosamine N-acyltransferase